MKGLNQHIDTAFSQAIKTLALKFKCKKNEAVLYLQFMERESKIFFYAKGTKLKQINFSQIIGSKMIGLGVTVEKLYLALHWLKSANQRQFKAEDKRISFLLFNTRLKNMALVGVCIDGKHILSYKLSDILEQFESKEQQLN